MYLAYSRFQNSQTQSPKKAQKKVSDNRLAAYQAVCAKYENEIAAVRKYIPGWQPKFNY